MHKITKKHIPLLFSIALMLRNNLDNKPLSEVNRLKDEVYKVIERGRYNDEQKIILNRLREWYIKNKKTT